MEADEDGCEQCREVEVRGVKCSWVEMFRIQQALAGGKRGDQERLTYLRCVDKGTVSRWRGVCDLMAAAEGKVAISQLSHVQPSHAAEIARAFRRREPDAAKWSEETRQEIADWVDRCEEEKWTVPQLRLALSEVSYPEVRREPFNVIDEARVIAEWLDRRLASWPEDKRCGFAPLLRRLIAHIEQAQEGQNHDEGGTRDGPA